MVHHVEESGGNTGGNHEGRLLTGSLSHTIQALLPSVVPFIVGQTLSHQSSIKKVLLQASLMEGILQLRFPLPSDFSLGQVNKNKPAPILLAKREEEQATHLISCCRYKILWFAYIFSRYLSSFLALWIISRMKKECFVLFCFFHLFLSLC